MNSRAREYFLEKDFNCAETVIRCANEELGLGLDESAMKLVGGFGGGMGCGRACGVLCAAVAALSSKKINGRAHATEGFRDACGDFVKKFEESLGSTECAVLKKKYFREGERCIDVVEKGLELLKEAAK